MSKKDPNITDELFDAALNLKCCMNCKKSYECTKEIMYNKLGAGVCGWWRYDGKTYAERKA